MKLREALLPRNHVSGSFGIEIEWEGELSNSASWNDAVWQLTGDGSLEGGGEFVLLRPLELKDAIKAVAELKSDLTLSGTSPQFSMRTSTHVHVNVQELEIAQVYTMIMLSWMYENLLVRYSGPEREGNMYCLRREDASAIELSVIQSIASNRVRDLLGIDMKYSAINLAALSKYGSIEFRSMRGTISPIILGKWLNLLSCLREAAKKFKTPIKMISKVESIGIAAFSEEVFGESLKWITKRSSWEQEVDSAFRDISYIAHMGDWRKKNLWKGRARPPAPRVPRFQNVTWDSARHLELPVYEHLATPNTFSAQYMAEPVNAPNSTERAVSLSIANLNRSIECYSHILLERLSDAGTTLPEVFNEAIGLEMRHNYFIGGGGSELGHIREALRLGIQVHPSLIPIWNSLLAPHLKRCVDRSVTEIIALIDVGMAEKLRLRKTLVMHSIVCLLEIEENERHSNS